LSRLVLRGGTSVTIVSEAFSRFRYEEVPMSEDNPPVSTGSGDDGTTTLLGGGRLAKDDERIALLGDIDEASASIGLARAQAEDAEIEELLMELQRLLYRIMADVGMPKEQNAVDAEDVKMLDEALENWRARTQLPEEFVVPGRNKLGAHLDFARSVVRRVERGMVTVDLVQDHPDAVEAVNRLSDLLFVVARNAEGKSTPSKG
jgi:cob(I)alamin adenosyltransferase